MSEFESKAQIEQLIFSKTSHGREGIVKKHVNRSNIPLFIMLMVIVCLGLVSSILYQVPSGMQSSRIRSIMSRNR